MIGSIMNAADLLDARKKRGSVEEQDQALRDSHAKLKESIEDPKLKEIVEQYSHCFGCYGYGGHGQGGVVFHLLKFFGELRKPEPWITLFSDKGICCLSQDGETTHTYSASNILKIKADKINGSTVRVKFNNELRPMVLCLGEPLAAQRPAEVMNQTIFNQLT